MRGLVLLVLALTLAGGAQNGKELQVDRPFDAGLLVATDRRWEKARAFMRSQTAGWFHEPCHVAGNFIQESWTRGPGSNLGLVPRLQESPGTGWYRWGVLHYELPNAFGLQLSAGHNPNPSGWGVACWYAKGGKTVLGDGAAVTFTRWEEGKAVEKLVLGEYSYDFGPDYPVRGAQLSLNMPNVDVRMAALWKDPATLEKCALDSLRRLESKAERALLEHRVEHKTYGKYNGDGIPPPEFRNPLTPAEEADLLKRLRDDLAHRRELVTTYAKDFNSLLNGLLPAQIWGIVHSNRPDR